MKYLKYILCKVISQVLLVKEPTILEEVYTRFTFWKYSSNSSSRVKKKKNTRLNSTNI